MLFFGERQRVILVAMVVMMTLMIFSTPYAYEAPNVPTQEKLYTFETPHFRIIYQESLAEAAPLIAEYSEEAFSVLTHVFGWLPEGKIDVLFVDGLDTHNGWATSVPHNTITIYAAGSEPYSSIYQPGDYLRRTVFHELTHAIIMDMRYGYNKILSQIFGKALPLGDPFSFATFLFTASPVLLSPRWLLEGESIWAETEFAPPGRGQSTFVDMIFRCAVRDNNLLPYSKWYIEIPHWPYGLGAYLYGMRFIQHIYETSDRHNPLGDLNKNIAQSFLFDSTRIVGKTTGKGFKTLAQEMLAREKKIQEDNLSVLETLSTTRPPRLTPFRIAVGQAISVENKAYFIGSQEEERNSLFVYDFENKVLQKIYTSKATSPFGSLTASKDGSHIFYTRLNVQQWDNLWYEIRRYNPKTGKDALVTNKGRYRAVDISPDDMRFAAVSQRGGHAYLLELDLDRTGRIADERILTKVPLQYDLSVPRYSPDGTKIVYVEAGDAGFWLKIYNLKTNDSQTVFKSNAQIVFPDWHPDGKSLIFTSDANGVYNLYQIQIGENRGPVPLSHITGGLFSPSFSQDGQDIVAVGFDGLGPHLTILPYLPNSYTGKELPGIRPTWKGGKKVAWLEKEREKGRKLRLAAEKQSTEPSRYNSFLGQRFDYWSPWLTASEDGVQGGAAASFSDPTGYQELKLLAGWESKYDTGLGAVHYFYRGLAPQFHLYALADQDVYPDLLVSQNGSTRFDHAEEVKKYGITVELPFLDLERQVSLEAGYEYKERKFIDEARDKYRGVPLSIEPTEKNQGLVWAKVTYFDGEVYGRSSSVEDGRMVSIGGELSRSSLGGELSRSRYLADWSEYISVPKLRNHVIKVSSAFGYGTGDSTPQDLFGLGGYAGPVKYLSPGIPSTLTLRGYDSNFQTGSSIVKAAASYRFPFLDFSRGMEGAFPIYFRQLMAEIFYEGGRTWDDEGLGDDLGWINSWGTEVNCSIKIFRYVAFSPGLGIAYARDRTRRDPEDDSVQIYLSVKGWVNF